MVRGTARIQSSSKPSASKIAATASFRSPRRQLGSAIAGVAARLRCGDGDCGICAHCDHYPQVGRERASIHPKAEVAEIRGAWNTTSNLGCISCAPSLDICICRCTLRGSEFGALHANFIEADTPARSVAPDRELTRLRVAHYPKPIGPIFASRGNVSPRQGFLPRVFCYPEPLCAKICTK